MRTCGARPWPHICSALNHRHPPSGPTRRSSRSIRARIPDGASGCAGQADDPVGPGLRERLRDGPGRPQAACAQLRVSRRFRAAGCVPTWSCPDYRRLSPHLEQADRHVAEAKQRLARQHDFIAMLESTNQPSEPAVSMLEAMEKSLQAFEHHRRLLELYAMP